MNLLLLFGLFPKEAKDEIIKNSKGVIQYAADALQWSFVNGLTHYYSDLNMINLPYIGSYPKLYTKKKENDYEFLISSNPNSPKAKNIGFDNFYGIRLISRYLKAKKEIFNWNREIIGEKIVIIYSLHLPFLKAAVKVKKKVPDVKICLIVPDIPIFKGNDSKYLTLINSFQTHQFNKLYPFIDKFVLLTENMKDYLPLADKKYTVIEGIFNFETVTDNFINDKDTTIKTIFYGGTLAHRYGVLNLVYAFTKLTDKNFRLVICGDGSAKDEICEISKKDNRILYKGQLPRTEVLNLILKSDLLVNPRTPEGEYTKYSFPSKTIEYLGSGIPTLLYKLDGIPKEYYDYCYSIEDTSIKALSEKIADILSKPYDELKRMGDAAKNFIQNEKNSIKQCEKIVSLINNN